MSDLFDDFTRRIQSLSDRFAKNGKKYLQSALFQGEKITHKGKIQVEIEKLKWELKQRYHELGKYVSEKKISKSATDFSHDKEFLELVDKVNRIKLYIDQRHQERDSKGNKLAGRT